MPDPVRDRLGRSFACAWPLAFVVAAIGAALGCGAPAATATAPTDASADLAPSDAAASDAGASASGYVPPDDAAACDPGDPQRERHGTSCLCCHTGDFTVAGSIDLTGPAVARVEVTDGFGNRAVMSPNPYGNFFRHNPLVPPLRVKVVGPDGSERSMRMPAPHTNCNECHRPGGAAPRIAGP